jgi:hypothetical protein
VTDLNGALPARVYRGVCVFAGGHGLLNLAAATGFWEAANALGGVVVVAVCSFWGHWMYVRCDLGPSMKRDPGAVSGGSRAATPAAVRL